MGKLIFTKTSLLIIFIIFSYQTLRAEDPLAKLWQSVEKKKNFNAIINKIKKLNRSILFNISSNSISKETFGRKEFEDILKKGELPNYLKCDFDCDGKSAEPVLVSLGMICFIC